MESITKETYLHALEIVHEYTVQQIRKETISDEKVVMESKRIYAIYEKVAELVSTHKITKTRKIDVVSKRTSIMWWLRNNTKITFQEIGEMLGGYDHSTVVHACKKHEDFVKIKDSKYLYYSEQVLTVLEPYKK